MDVFKRLISSCVALDQENIDTDQIIPARFLTATQFQGLGQHAFADWRFDGEGRPRGDNPLNQPEVKYRKILVAGSNFGCGSSREHAPRALYEFGFRAIISTRIADIFRNNAFHCGLLAIELGLAEVTWLLQHPQEEIIIDLEEQYVELAGGHRARFEIDPFARHCLLQGLDPQGFIQSQEAAIRQYEAEHDDTPTATGAAA